MGRLKRAAPMVQPLRPMVAYLEQDEHRNRRDTSPIRRLYSTARWRRLRWEVLTGARFTCARCGRLEGDTSLLECDHIEPHRGCEVLFWRRDNLQCLCKPCHAGAKQREEAAGRSGGGWSKG